MGWIFVGARGGLSVPWSGIPWGRVLYFGVVATAFILVLQTWALGKTKPVRAGVIYSLEPVFAAVEAVDPIRRITSCPLGLKGHINLCPLHRRLDSAIHMVEEALRASTIAELLAEPSLKRGIPVPLCS